MRPNRLPRDTEDIPRGYVYCANCDEYLAPGTAYDCAHGVPFGRPVTGNRDAPRWNANGPAPYVRPF
jgi:hypothetical protein